ncbi:hypothetical protein Slin15195_G066860 [Septoria linicola]|uniref:Uncharacterized protein n=1 Tax=Septoria linicola TaxID=215465 RepID=A0A9Q9AWS1_9PEZI|nr:hypothetical protein Slin14017_G099570 [Septoria linicola]USW53367.1 hypothetical protein Slin15195_G066860 [Septoria linicola]
MPSSSDQAAVGVVDFRYPAEYDVFWLNPLMRLPDPATKLTDEEKKIKLATGREQTRQLDRNAAWEESWSALQGTLGTV